MNLANLNRRIDRLEQAAPHRADLDAAIERELAEVAAKLAESTGRPADEIRAELVRDIWPEWAEE